MQPSSRPLRGGDERSDGRMRSEYDPSSSSGCHCTPRYQRLRILDAFDEAVQSPPRHHQSFTNPVHGLVVTRAPDHPIRTQDGAGSRVPGVMSTASSTNSGSPGAP